MPCSRRRLLGASAATLGALLTGCVSQPSSESSSTTTATTTTTQTTATTTTRTTTPKRTTAVPLRSLGETAPIERGREQGDVTVDRVQGQRQYFIPRLRGGGRRQLEGDPTQAYLWTSVVVEWGEQSTNCIYPSDGFMRVVLDGDAYPIAEACAYERGQNPDDGQVVFGVPADGSVSEGRFEWIVDNEPLAAWRLPQAAIEWLNHPPAFEVKDVTIPEQVQDGERVTISMRVANEGERDGTFRYLTDSSYSTAVRLGTATIPADEAVSVDEEVRVSSSGSTVTVDWAYDTFSQSVGGCSQSSCDS